MQTYTVVVDGNEQIPLPIPSHLVVWKGNKATTVKLEKEIRRIGEGDYFIEGYEKRVLVERKYNIRELWQNVISKDRDRFIRALDRLAAACTRPYMLIEGSPYDLLGREGFHVNNTDTSVILSRLTQDIHARRINVVFMSTGTGIQRTRAGEFLCHLLMAGVFEDELPDPDPPEDSGSGGS